MFALQITKNYHLQIYEKAMLMHVYRLNFSTNNIDKYNQGQGQYPVVRLNRSTPEIGHHFGMHCHVSSDVDDVIYPANCFQK